MKRLLIGSCGGLTGIYLARQYSRYSNLYLYGADSSTNSIGKYFVSKLLHVPVSQDISFIPELIKILNDYKIDYYIPTHSKEIIEISKNEALIRSSSYTNFIVSPIRTYNALDQKDVAYKNMSKLGIYCPQIYKNEQDIHLPAFYKRKIGSGSKGTGIIYNIDEFKVISETDNDLFVCQYLKGKEYTVDCLFDYNGNLLGYNQRRRVRSIGGAVSVTTNDNTIDILPTINRLSENFIFRGCINFQYILVEGKPYIIDVNLRFASGGLPLSVKSGVNVPKAYLDLFENRTIKPCEFESDMKPRTMYRYFDEIYDDRSI